MSYNPFKYNISPLANISLRSTWPIIPVKIHFLLVPSRFFDRSFPLLGVLREGWVRASGDGRSERMWRQWAHVSRVTAHIYIFRSDANYIYSNSTYFELCYRDAEKITEPVRTLISLIEGRMLKIEIDGWRESEPPARLAANFAGLTWLQSWSVGPAHKPAQPRAQSPHSHEYSRRRRGRHHLKKPFRISRVQIGESSELNTGRRMWIRIRIRIGMRMTVRAPIGLLKARRRAGRGREEAINGTFGEVWRGTVRRCRKLAYDKRTARRWRVKKAHDKEIIHRYTDRKNGASASGA